MTWNRVFFFRVLMTLTALQEKKSKTRVANLRDGLSSASLHVVSITLHVSTRILLRDFFYPCFVAMCTDVHVAH